MKIVVYAIFAFSLSANAQQAATPTVRNGPVVTCGSESGCSPSQTLQDQSSSSLNSRADGSQSQATQSNPSSNSNASGININPATDVKGSVNQTPTQTQNQSGTQSSNAGAYGNQSDNKNNASNGQSNTGTIGSVKSGSNSQVGDLTTGPSTSSANNGGNKNDNANDNSSGASSVSGSTSKSAGGKASATGGSGGSGGNGGSGGSATGGQSSVGSVGGGSASGTASTGPVTNQIGTTVDAADRSTTNNVNNTRVDARTLVLAPFTQPIAPGVTNSGGITQITTACGPQMVKTTVPLETFRGGFFHDKMVNVGYTEDVIPSSVPFRDEPLTDGREGFTRWGMQAVIMTTKVGTSTNKGASIGGNGGNSFSGGQAGFGSASASEQIAKSITLVPCQVAVIVHEKPAPITPPVVLTPTPQSDETVPVSNGYKGYVPHTVKPATHKRKAAVCAK